MTMITAIAQTNSYQAIPEMIRANMDELKQIHEESKPAFLAGVPGLLTLLVTALPTVEFLDEDDDYDKWEQTVTMVGLQTVSVIFTHTSDGSEMFAEFDMMGNNDKEIA
ncbi:hypothetical protein [Reinekea sp. G2M2-21]|uniref:hypothetical protein n=1 Tax=Reinekea sp. G2M2-21 TaxID=2788942 RepID=UPI0018AC3B6B|nr:hypothetical protein [Reinekea sp. G2M2-21]